MSENADSRTRQVFLLDSEARQAITSNIVDAVGTEGAVAPFYELVGGREEFERLCPNIELDDSGDIFKFAEKIKRALEKHARAAEDKAQWERGAAATYAAEAEGIDLEAESNQEVLFENLKTAILHQADLERRLEISQKAEIGAEVARKLLEEAKVKWAGLPTVAEAESSHQLASTEMENAHALVEKLEAELKVAERAAAAAILESWPPDNGWHFRPGEFAFNGTVGSSKGKVLALLEFLAKAKRAVTKLNILESVWHEKEASGEMVDDQNVKVHMTKVRKLLRAAFMLGSNIDPLPNVDTGANCAWKLDETVLISQQNS